MAGKYGKLEDDDLCDGFGSRTAVVAHLGMGSSIAESGGVQVKIFIAVFAALLVFTALFTMACTSPTPDGPHELVLTVSGTHGNESMRREEVLGALVSREACRSAMTK